MLDRKYSTRSIPSVWRTVSIGGIWLGGSLDSLEIPYQATRQIRFDANVDANSNDRVKQRSEGSYGQSKNRRTYKRSNSGNLIKKARMIIHRWKEKDIMRDQRNLVIADMIKQNIDIIERLQTSLKEVVNNE